MALDPTAAKALCFDLGNTLIEFGPRQIAHQFSALKRTLEDLFGGCDEGRLKEVRDRQIMAPYRNGYREHNLEEISAELIRELFGIEPEGRHVEAMATTRQDAFLEVVALAEEVRSLLEALGRRYRLALLSNYPCGFSIRSGLDKLELTRFFEVIVVSGEIGFVKPHPKPYETMLAGLDLEAGDCVYIGDNWLADIQGAKGLGMQAILTTQHAPYENFPRRDGDHEPDARIAHLGELEGLFLGPEGAPR